VMVVVVVMETIDLLSANEILTFGRVLFWVVVHDTVDQVQYRYSECCRLVSNKIRRKPMSNISQRITHVSISQRLYFGSSFGLCCVCNKKTF
jgi:archaellum biogenesis protein FlaJ (TadC family)